MKQHSIRRVHAFLILIVIAIIHNGCQPYQITLSPSLLEKNPPPSQKISGHLGLYIDPEGIQTHTNNAEILIESQRDKNYLDALIRIFIDSLTPLFDKVSICQEDPLTHSWQTQNLDFFARVKDFKIVESDDSTSDTPNISVEFIISFYKSSNELIGQEMKINENGMGADAFPKAFQAMYAEMGNENFSTAQEGKKIVTSVPIGDKYRIIVERDQDLEEHHDKLPEKMKNGVDVFRQGKEAMADANIEEATEKFQDAIDILIHEKSNEHINELTASYYYLAYIYAGSNDIRKAKELVSTALQIDPNIKIPAEISTPQLKELSDNIRQFPTGE